jgi:hypothetical protein
MWKTILDNINSLILGNWKSLFMFAVGVLAGVFLLSCSMINGAIDTTQEVVNDAVEYVTGADEESDAPADE